MWWPMILTIYLRCFRWWIVEGHRSQNDKGLPDDYEKKPYD